MTSPYPHLLSPIDVAHLRLPNRVLMGSMHVGLEEEWGRYRKLAAYFAARAAGGVGLIVTGGIAPDRAGRAKPFAAKLTSWWEVRKHRYLTDAVHEAGGRICMQILHTGRYAYHPFCVAPSAIKAPIAWFKPRALSARRVEKTIAAFVACASRARRAGYDGVEVMGSEGYLINQFIVERTNRRDDQWGGPFASRIRFPIEIVRRTREAVGPDFVIVYRLSMLDLVEEGSSWDEVVQLARQIEAAGASLINTGIGWHEARVPTIATMVPRAGFTWVTRRLRGEVSVPLVASNRINMPDVAEAVIAAGDADMVSMARPLLADSDWVAKAAAGRADEINTCIACNQACLDFIFRNRRATCLVNPMACRELEWKVRPAVRRRRVAVVGAGPAGLACALGAAQRGLEVTLFEAADQIGGQFNMAMRIPGKEEFAETLRYYARCLERTGVAVRLSHRAGAAELAAAGFDDVVLATGVVARRVSIPGADRPHVLGYADVLGGGAPAVGPRVAIIGAGGIGIDVAAFLVAGETNPARDIEAFCEEWGIDRTLSARGAVKRTEVAPPGRQVTICQRSHGKLAGKLGKTTGWIHRVHLKNKGVRLLSGCRYDCIDDAGLRVTAGGRTFVVEVDTVVVCAGQEPQRELVDPLRAARVRTHIIGGADRAVELDAQRAIEQGTRLAMRL